MPQVGQVTALIQRDGEAYVALCPEFDVASEGRTLEEARRNLVDAVEGFLAAASPDEIQERYAREFYVTRVDVRVG